MALNPDYFVAQDLQALFLDKDTLTPLSGTVSFFIDTARNTPKDVYQLSGSPPNYSYVNIGSTITLDGTGAFPYIVYLYPYDIDANVELYYVTITSSTGILQRTVEAWPNGVAQASSISTNEIINYIPNPQFWSHNFTSQVISASSTQIAPGGWSFIRSASSPGTDTVSFERIISYSTNPSANPRYRTRFQCTSAATGETQKGYLITFQNVNQFASDIQLYTFSVTGYSNTGGNLTIPIQLIKYFGVGGSATEIIDIGSFIFTPTETLFTLSFIFGGNSGFNIGTADDDYVAIYIGSPLNTTTDFYFTNALLTIGEYTIDTLPPQPIYESQSLALAGSLTQTDPTGFNLYLPTRLGKNGLEYDDTMIGVPYPKFTSALEVGELAYDGSQYDVDGISSDGIPYKRLYNKIGTQFGTGSDYFSFYNDVSGLVLGAANTPGAISNFSNGATSPGFTYTTILTGVADRGFWASPNRYTPPTTALVISKAFGYAPSAAWGTGTSPITVTMVESNYYNPTTDTTGRSRFLYQLGGFGSSAASAFNSTYFKIATPTVNYYIWFNYNGTGTDPAPGGTGIQVYLTSSDAETTILRKVILALQSVGASTITTVAGSLIPTGAYFIFTSPAASQYVVWFQVNGVGTPPIIAGAKKTIQVSIASTDTAAAIATNLTTVLNQQYFSVWNGQGMILRGWDPNSIYDIYSKTYRYFPNQMLNNTNFGLGSIQFPMSLSHTHSYTHTAGTSGQGGSQTPGTLGPAKTGSAGMQDLTMWNTAVNWVTKY